MKRFSEIVGTDGEPLQVDVLTDEEYGDSQLAGVRSVWNHTSIASYLTPARLATVLENANSGMQHEFLTLAEEMEERDPHYGGVIGTRKRAVSGISPEVIAASDSAQDELIATDVKHAIADRGDFPDLVEALLDGLGKGYSAVRNIWETSEKQWHIAEFRWTDPRFFNLDQKNGSKLLLITPENAMGEPLVPHAFSVHVPRIKCGLPVRGALGRLIAVSYMCKGVALADWMTFAELFGMPVRIGKYGRNAKPSERATLRSAVASIGSDAAAIIPESMSIEFLDSGKGTGGHVLFETLCKYLDKQISKGVLGQTMTTDDGSSHSQANVHNDVRIDILKADKRQLEATIARDIVKPYVDFNYGPQENYPRITLPIVEPEDMGALVDAVERLVPIGLKVKQRTMQEKLGLPEVDDKDQDDLLGAPSKSPSVSDGNAPTALNRQQTAFNDLEDFDDALDDWQPQMTPIITPVETLANNSRTAEEFKAGLPGLLDTMDASELINALATSSFKAFGQGDVED